MDIFNKDKIFKLKIELSQKDNELNKAKQDIQNLTCQLDKYKNLVKNEHYTVQDLTNLIDNLTNNKNKLEQEISKLSQKLNDINTKIDTKYLQSIALKDINPTKSYSHELKPKIISNKSTQKDIVKNKQAILCSSNGIELEGNEYQGKILTNNISNLMLTSFNLQCDNVLNGLKQNNLEQSVDRLSNIIYNINKQGDILNLSINPQYSDLKIKELYLQYEYINLLQKEKEKFEHEKEILRDQAKSDKELTKLQEKQEHELNNLKYQYNVAVTKNKELSLINELKVKIDQLEGKLNITKHKLTDNKCGYVYVISNRDMYPNQYKIGVTRREDIDKRMRELSDAGHSFIMEVNGCIWVDKVYEIETQLHQYLQDKRININGTRKEWFNVTLDEIKKAFKDCCGLDIELNEQPCQDYLDSKEKFEFL